MGYFDNLKIDSWFKAVTYLGGIIVLLSLTVPIQIVSNEIMAAIGFGTFLYGIGRWKNVKTHTQFTPTGMLSWQDRHPDLIGLLLELLGVAIILFVVGYMIYSNF